MSLKKYFQIASIAKIFALHASFSDQWIANFVLVVDSCLWNPTDLHICSEPHQSETQSNSRPTESNANLMRNSPEKPPKFETAGRVVFLTAHTYKGHLWFWQSLGSRKISLFFGLDVQFCVQVNFFEVWIQGKFLVCLPPACQQYQLHHHRGNHTAAANDQRKNGYSIMATRWR